MDGLISALAASVTLWVRTPLHRSTWIVPVNAIVQFYDFSLVLTPEVSLVWLSPWSTVKSIYIMSKYLYLLALCLFFYGSLYLLVTKFLTEYTMHFAISMRDSRYLTPNIEHNVQEHSDTGRRCASHPSQKITLTQISFQLLVFCLPIWRKVSAGGLNRHLPPTQFKQVSWHTECGLFSERKSLLELLL
jgi:hypothetical protein